MLKIIPYALLQSILLVSTQVLLKIALARMLPVGWNMAFVKSVLVNLPFALCGICFAASALLWTYMLKTFPFSVAYPMISLSYVLGMVAAMVIFHESVSMTKWAGVALIIAGCCLIAK